MTDKQPQTCYVFIKASDRLPLVTKKCYACNVENTISGQISGMVVYCAESNWDVPYPLRVIEFMESLPSSVYIHTPEELAKAFREAAEKTWNAARDESPFSLNKGAYLDRHYPLPQPINTNI